MAERKSDEFQFQPEAMLPAWVVADSDLVVRHRNNFAFQLLGAVSKSELFFNDLLSLRLDNFPTEQHESLWKCILDPQYPNNFEYVAGAIKVLDTHVKILKEFLGEDEPYAADQLVERLKGVTVGADMKDAVVPYIIRPLPEVNESEFVMGVKISPPQGLKLIRAVELENSVVEYVDIVMAYQLRSDWSFDRKLRRVNFLGTQPAIHDATFRHGLWERVKLEEQAEITQFLSHAFKTPISNIQSMARELQQSELSGHYREVCEKLDAQVTDLGNLSDLILFINTSTPIPARLCASEPADEMVWEYITIDEVKDEIQKTLLSVHKGRTRDPSDKKKVELLAGLDGDGASPELLDCVKLAEDILDVQQLGEQTTFGLLLPGSPDLEAQPKKAAEIAKKIKTTFLNLLLAELLLNAIKYSNSDAPVVKIQFDRGTANTLVVNIINNGTALTENEFKNARKELANKPGEKRRALGLLLNLRAAEILGWKLRWTRPARPGTHLTLHIPFKD